MLSLDTCDPIEGCDVRCFKTEAELLIGFRDLILEEDPDIYDCL